MISWSAPPDCPPAASVKAAAAALLGRPLDAGAPAERVRAHGTINREDLRLFHRTDSADEAFEIVTRHLTEYAMAERGAFL